MHIIMNAWCMNAMFMLTKQAYGMNWWKELHSTWIAALFGDISLGMLDRKSNISRISWNENPSLVWTITGRHLQGESWEFLILRSLIPSGTTIDVSFYVHNSKESVAFISKSKKYIYFKLFVSKVIIKSKSVILQDRIKQELQTSGHKAQIY